ncbi:MAG: TlpA disulfide reductase family protein [Holophagaceae bacterium]
MLSGGGRAVEEDRLEALRDAWNRWGCFVSLGAAALLLFGGVWSVRRDHAPRVGADVRAVAFRDAEGRRHTLAEYAGRPVVVDVWATWCPPCRASLPELAKLQAEGGSRHAVIPLSVDEAGFQAVSPFLARQGLALTTFVPEGPEALEPFGPVSVIPTTILVDAKGKLVTRWSGYAPGRVEAELRKAQGF